eukprot:TRINITY_DN844_c0_g1_i2.p1 TRINITY_DN844_c0_g1~~TRINITY_DN844_c0_g1_i2.p1  ORF type:complete len:250 (+),score=55.77 TRINITY_DN844_c0_g1_i2:54-803(+)
MTTMQPVKVEGFFYQQPTILLPIPQISDLKRDCAMKTTQKRVMRKERHPSTTEQELSPYKRKKSSPVNPEKDKKQKKIESNVAKRMKERQRRSQMSEAIAELRKIIPQSGEMNQALVMCSTVTYILDLQNKLEELERENMELKAQLANSTISSRPGSTTFENPNKHQLFVPGPNSPFESTSDSSSKSEPLTPPLVISPSIISAPVTNPPPISISPSPVELPYCFPDLPDMPSAMDLFNMPDLDWNSFFM